ncbi:amino acid transporter AVT3B [Exaiptasia diaphana]|uniref:Amino acid transporter transmembrane domain-containing protein n=1 Tax=Exaiptasia diaphana TaxID=2652724 RepID=A0A913Y6S0_EXADI|nr:amino acid transporter AVT3B [Exaiptasia diaphana]KXJ22393.1 Amino acid transporter ANTL1 [Exaiptasia diaphana]
MHGDGATSTTTIFANIFISFIGAGILGMPFAIKEAGVIEGSVVMAIVGIVSVKAMLLVIDCKYKTIQKKCGNGKSLKAKNSEASFKGEAKQPLFVEDGKNLREMKDQDQEIDYGDLGLYALGPIGKMLVDTSIVVSQIGFSCGYLIFISENIADMTSDHFSKFAVLMAMLPPLLVLVNFRHLKRLAIFSIFADFANVFAYCVVFWFDFEHFDRVRLHPTLANLDGLPFFLGIAIYCYEGAGMILALELSCAKEARPKFRKIFKFTLGLVTTLTITFGACGYLSFGTTTRTIITLNLPPGPFPVIVRSCLCFSLFFTYPVMMFPAVAILEKQFVEDKKYQFYYGSLIRVLVVVSSGLIVMVIPNFSILMSLVGSSCCTLLSFIFPALFHLKIFQDELTFSQRATDFFIIGVGMIGTLIGTSDVIRRLRSH